MITPDHPGPYTQLKGGQNSVVTAGQFSVVILTLVVPQAAPVSLARDLACYRIEEVCHG
jgi:hypothetical protein